MEQRIPFTGNLRSVTADASSRSGRFLTLVLLASPILLFGITVLVWLGLGMVDALGRGIRVVSIGFLAFVVIAGLGRLVQMVFSTVVIRGHTLCRQLGLEWSVPASPRVPPISVIVWAHNRAAILTERIEALLALDYPNFEIIVVNDGSTDSTLSILQSAFQLGQSPRIIRRSLPTATDGVLYASARIPNLIVIEKPWSGRGDSLNFALNVATYPYVCVVDLDLRLQKQALIQLAKGVIEDHRHTIAVAGLAGFSDEVDFTDKPIVTSSANTRRIPSVTRAAGPIASVASRSLVRDLHRIDRLAGFHSGYLARAGLGTVPVADGVVRLVRKARAIDVGGFDAYTEGESIDLLVRMRAGDSSDGDRIVFSAEVLARIEADDDLNAVSSASRRWQHQAMAALMSHWRSLLGTSRIRLAFPVFLFLDVLGPVVELGAFLVLPMAVAFGALTVVETRMMLLSLIIFALVHSVGGVLCEDLSERSLRQPGEFARLLLAAVVHAFGYRQLAAFWKLRGTIDYVLGR